MPFVSAAQKRKFEEMVKEGKMSQATFDEWNRNSPDHLPERAHKKHVEKKPKSPKYKKHW